MLYYAGALTYMPHYFEKWMIPFPKCLHLVGNTLKQRANVLKYLTSFI